MSHFDFPFMKLMYQSDHVNSFRCDTKHVIFSADVFEDDVLDRSKLKVEGRKPARLVGQRNICHLCIWQELLALWLLFEPYRTRNGGEIGSANR